jgi:hypothetical protein
VKQRDVSGTVWVVLDVSNSCWNTIFVVTTEVDYAVLTLVATTDVTSGALRPPVFDNGRSSDFSGVVRVISAKSETDEPRRPGVVGLYLRIAI